MDFKTSPEDEYYNTDTTAYILRMSLPCTEAFLKLGSSTDTHTAGVYFRISVETGEQLLVDPVTLLLTTGVFKANHGGFEEHFFIYVMCFSV